ncbi:MAG: 1-deoxy-D-xylulose-5-phosphate reductoisomerase [Calditrichaeota bacterium]|nr:1-deoxy-D-xylulose-5-phosphate reductoisomerase [Calditrichota bacterium]
MKRIAILGSTGSIGRNALEVIDAYQDEIEIVGLSTHQRVDLLFEQCVKFKPKAACVTGTNSPIEMIERIRKLGVKVFTGAEGLKEIATATGASIVINALVGAIGLVPTLAAIEKKIDIALANKETLVMAGELVTSFAAQKGVRLLPVDSEHSAIFQCLQGENIQSVRRLILTASGGPFYKLSQDELKRVTIEQALKHPNWEMGHKITIDSATLMNKGLEVIEAYWLFKIPVSRIDVVIHPQSIIHSFVEFIDGSVKAQLGAPDMKLPIQYALTYPERWELKAERVNFAELKQFTFEKPDFDKFPALRLAYQAIQEGGTAPAALNAANEVAVQNFLRKRIPFLDIARYVDRALQKHSVILQPALEDILAADLWARNFVNEAIDREEILPVSF